MAQKLEKSTKIIETIFAFIEKKSRFLNGGEELKNSHLQSINEIRLKKLLKKLTRTEVGNKF